MPKFYLDKGLQAVDFKYPVDKLAGAFVKMGFAGDDTVEVNGINVVPRDVLMRLVKRPGSSFIDETEATILQSELTGILEITVDGERNGAKVSHIISYKFSDRTDKELQQQLFSAYGTTRVYVSQPAVVGAKMCLNGDVAHGVISPDSLKPEEFFEGMAERGVPFVIEEKVITQTTFS